MQSYQIQDLKDFMKKLLLTETFDAFLLSEASVTTYAAFHLDGSIHPDYFSTDEAKTLTTCLLYTSDSADDTLRV